MINQTPISLHRSILSLAIPSIISNVTVPLLSLVDLAIVGHLNQIAYVGAIALGGMFIHSIYWLLGFLRMGTGGLTAQAYGKQGTEAAHLWLWRSLCVGGVFALLIVLFQSPLLSLAFYLKPPAVEVQQFTRLYFQICIWGAPATLGLYAFNGWFIGMQNSRIPMYIAICQNLLNTLLSLALVWGWGMQLEGVALGTLVSQYVGLAMAICFYRLKYYSHTLRLRWDMVCDREAFSRFFGINRNIFLRTLCLVCVTLFFTTEGGVLGAQILVVNTLLMQFFTLFSYFMDGFADAGEALTGRYLGSGQTALLSAVLRHLLLWGLGLALLFSTLYVAGAPLFLRVLTDNSESLTAATSYLYWVYAIPLCGFAAFLWDGILIGATATRPMLIAMALATFCFFSTYLFFKADYGNHALWGAFVLYLSVRSWVQTFQGAKLFRLSFFASKSDKV